MKKTLLPRNTLVQSSLEGKNNLGKGGVIQSEKDREKHNRAFQKSKWKKDLYRSGDDRSFFLAKLVYQYNHSDHNNHQACNQDDLLHG